MDFNHDDHEPSVADVAGAPAPAAPAIAVVASDVVLPGPAPCGHLVKAATDPVRAWVTQPDGSRKVELVPAHYCGTCDHYWIPSQGMTPNLPDIHTPPT